MFVRPAFRSSGIAPRRSSRYCFPMPASSDTETARLETMTFMREAHDLYRSIGFVDSEPFEAEGSKFGVAQCELFMTLSLK